MKSHCSIERKVCPICTKEFDSGAILLDRRLRDSMDRHPLRDLHIARTAKKRNVTDMLR